jgi:hypothetical protein
MSLKLPEPIIISKKLAQELDELERKGETIVSFCGYSNIEALFYLYLIKKYKSNCVTKKTGRLAPSDTLLGMSINIKFKLTKEEESKMHEGFLNLAKTLIQCIKKGENTIIIPLDYYKGYQLTAGHSNVLIYRRRTSVIEHFEPHGGLYNGSEREQLNIENKIIFFIRIFNAELKKNNIPDVSYVEAISVCPYLKGLQTLEYNSLLKRDKTEPGGYCSVWSMFFAELCLKNPDKSSEEILENIYIYLTTKESSENYLRKVIRGYTGYLVESVNTYLKIFFKPTYTVTDIIGFSKNFKFSKVYKIRNAIRLLIDLESEILLNDDYDLEEDLKNVKKMYNKEIKGMTIEQQIEARHKDKVVQPLYYKKRILQNYEEYSNYGKISEAIVDSPLELMEDTVTDHPLLNKRQKTQTQKVKTAIEPAPVPKAKTRTRRLSPNTIQNREALKQSRKAMNDLVREEQEKRKFEKTLAKLAKELRMSKKEKEK